MSEPLQLVDQDGGPIKVYWGDPKTINLSVQGEDLSTRTYSAHVRKSRRSEEVLAAFTCSASWNPITGVSVVTMFLRGDSSAEVNDGLTRLVPTKALMDVQEFDAGGIPLRTIAQAELIGVRDVTRSATWVPPGGGSVGAQYVYDTDPRLSDARIPIEHAASHGPGAPDQIQPLIHYQSIATTEWLIPHLFGYEPLVEIYDTAGTQLNTGVVSTPTLTTITFGRPTDGKAILE